MSCLQLQKYLSSYSNLHLHIAWPEYQATETMQRAGKTASHQTRCWNKNCQLSSWSPQGRKELTSDLHPLQSRPGRQSSCLVTRCPSHLMSHATEQGVPSHHPYFSPPKTPLADHKNRSLLVVLPSLHKSLHFSLNTTTCFSTLSPDT